MRLTERAQGDVLVKKERVMKGGGAADGRRR